MKPLPVDRLIARLDLAHEAIRAALRGELQPARRWLAYERFLMGGVVLLHQASTTIQGDLRFHWQPPMGVFLVTSIRRTRGQAAVTRIVRGYTMLADWPDGNSDERVPIGWFPIGEKREVLEIVARTHEVTSESPTPTVAYDIHGCLLDFTPP